MNRISQFSRFQSLSKSLIRYLKLFISLSIFIQFGFGLTPAYSAKIGPAPKFFTTTPDGSEFREGHFSHPSEAYFHVFLPSNQNNGPKKKSLTDGDYIFQVTDPRGRILLSSDAAECRIIRIENDQIVSLRQPISENVLVNRFGDDSCNTQDDPDGLAGSSLHHDTNTDLWNGVPALAVQLMPFVESPNPGHVHRLWLTPWDKYLDFGGDPLAQPIPICRTRQPVECQYGEQLIGYMADPGFHRHSRLRSHNFQVIPETGNQPPIADAGPDQEILIGAATNLNGTDSSDPDGDPLTYSWSITQRPTGSNATLDDPNSVTSLLQTDLPGTYIISLVVNDGLVDSDLDSVSVSTGNTPPVANAGADQTGFIGTTVTLDGSLSSDENGDALTFTWTLVSRPNNSTATLTSADQVNPSFIIDVPGTYVYGLIVNDGQADSAQDTVLISTENSPPIADAGEDQSVFINTLIQLDGSGSMDIDGDSLTYFWSISNAPTGSNAVLSDQVALMPTFTNDIAGSYTIQLVVSDGIISSSADIVIVTTLNSPPVANAGIDQTVSLGGSVTLTGDMSFDVDGDALSYAWSFTSVPTGSIAMLSNATAAMPEFVTDLAGTYIIQLIVNDGLVNSTADTVEINTSNSQPLADAGEDQSVAVGQIVMLDGRSSSDPDGDALSYRWSIVDKPLGSNATLSNSTSDIPNFTADVAGNYVVQLIVNDQLLDSDPDTVTISTINTRPVADAGLVQTIQLGNTVFLDGSNSSDADGDVLSFSWSISSAPMGNTVGLLDADTGTPSFIPNLPGIYVIQLIVNDQIVDSAPDTVVITLENTAPVANAGPDQNVQVGAIVSLDGSASFDANDQTLSYSWVLLSPTGSTTILIDANTVNPSFMVDLAGTYEAQLIVNDGFIDSVADVVSISTINNPPQANTGPDQAVNVGDFVNLDGSASNDPDGDSLNFSWVLTGVPAGSTATLSDPTSVTPTFTADLPGTYTAELVVNDGALDSPVDSVTISTNNRPPTANAGADQLAALVDDIVILDGSSSTDPDGDALSYSWVFISTPVGSLAALSNSDTANPTFTIDQAGSYEIALTVNDGTVDSATDTVVITTINRPPTADAGPDQTTADVNDTITLDGSASTDLDGDMLTYAWTLTSKPIGSSASLSDGTSAMPTFGLDIRGQYTATLIVNDGSVDSLADTVIISTANVAPIANAGADQTQGLGAIVTLDGSASSDADGDALSYSWSLTPPLGSIATLSDATAVNPSFVIDLPGDYSAELIVNDGALDSAPDAVILSTTNSAPVANAGEPQNVAVGELVNLDASGSSDSDNDPITYLWSLVSQPVGANVVLSDTNIEMPSFNASIAGLYIFQLIVNDGMLDSTPDTVTISTGNILTLSLEDALIGVGRSTTVTATLSIPAPPGGLIVNLSLDDPFAELSVSSISYAAGETQQTFQLTGLLAGITQLNGSSLGTSSATAIVEVTDVLISIDQIEIIAPDETTSVVISITEPAPPQGLVITLTVADPLVATVTPLTVFVPAGQFTPSANAQIYGVDFGATSIKATAPGYAPDVRDILVSLEASFDPAPIAVQMPFTGETVLKLDSPAPAGGITFDLTVDDPLVTLATQITIPEGQTQSPPIELTGVNQGTTFLRAIAPNVTETNTTVNVTAAQAFLHLFSSYVEEAVVGIDLQRAYGVRMLALPPSPVDVRISVPPGSGVLLSKSTTVVGSESVLYEDVTSAGTPNMYFQGTELGDDVSLTIEIFEANTTTPIGYNILPSTVDVDPSGVYISNRDYSTTTLSADTAVSAYVAILYDNEGPGIENSVRDTFYSRVSAGKTLTVPIVTSAPGVATLKQSPTSASSATGMITVLEGEQFGSILVDPLTSGEATVSIDTPLPTNFSIPGGTNYDDNVVVTVNAPDAFLHLSNRYIEEAIVGVDLQRPYGVRMPTSPPSPVDVRISVPPGSGVLLSKSTAVVGGDSLLYEDVIGQYLNSSLYFQGTELGDDVPLTIEIFEANTTTPIGYNILPSTVDVDPSGVYISNRDYSTTTLSADTAVDVYVAILYDNEGLGIEGNVLDASYSRVRAGKTLTVPIVTSAPGVAALRQDPTGTGSGTGTITILEAARFGSILVDPLTSGEATVSIDTPLPTNFSIPGGTNYDDNVVVTVNAPDAFLHLSNRYIEEAIVGVDLQRPYGVRMPTSPPSPVDVRISVPPGSGVLLSKSTAVVGGDSLLYEDVIGQYLNSSLYFQGTELGDDVPLTIEIFEANTTTPIGYNILPSTVDVDPSGVYISNRDYSTTTLSADTAVSAYVAILYDNEGPGIENSVRDTFYSRVSAGKTLTVPIVTSALGVATLKQSPTSASSATGMITVLEGEQFGSILVDPLTSGEATVSIDTPLPTNFSIPGGTNYDDNVVVTVDAPDTQLSVFGLGITHSVDLGNQLQLFAYVQLEIAPPVGNPVDVTVEVIDPSVALISLDADTVGTNSLVYPSATTSGIIGSLYIQGLTLGAATQIKVSAPGYDDWLVDVEIINSGFRLNGTTTVGAGSTANLSIAAVTLNSNNTIKDLNFHTVRGGTTQNIDISSTDPATGTVVSPVALSGGDHMKNSQFTAVAAGSTIVEITQPNGFTPPAAQTKLDITVN